MVDRKLTRPSNSVLIQLTNNIPILYINNPYYTRRTIPMFRKCRVNLERNKISVLKCKRASLNEMSFSLILAIFGYFATFDNSFASLHDVWVATREYTTLHHREIWKGSLEQNPWACSAEEHCFYYSPDLHWRSSEKNRQRMLSRVQREKTGRRLHVVLWSVFCEIL